MRFLYGVFKVEADGSMTVEYRSRSRAGCRYYLDSMAVREPGYEADRIIRPLTAADAGVPSLRFLMNNGEVGTRTRPPYFRNGTFLDR